MLDSMYGNMLKSKTFWEHRTLHDLIVFKDKHSSTTCFFSLDMAWRSNSRTIEYHDKSEEIHVIFY